MEERKATELEPKPRFSSDWETLKKQHEFQLMEIDYMGSLNNTEIEGGSDVDLLVRFLLHFLFVPHDSHQIELFEKAS